MQPGRVANLGAVVWGLNGRVTKYCSLQPGVALRMYTAWLDGDRLRGGGRCWSVQRAENVLGSGSFAWPLIKRSVPVSETLAHISVMLRLFAAWSATFPVHPRQQQFS